MTTTYVNSALHPSAVVKLSTGFGEGGNVTAAGWQETLCDPICYEISHSGEVPSRLLYSYLYFAFTFIVDW